MSSPSMAGANCPLRLCDQGVTGVITGLDEEGDEESFRPSGTDRHRSWY
jgi:hypothetical protein